MSLSSTLTRPRIATFAQADTLRVLILMSDTGGGHRSSAIAIQTGFVQQAGPQVNVRIVDLLRDHLPPPFRTLPATYPLLVNRTPRLWHLLWRTIERDAGAAFLVRRVVPRVAGRVARLLAAYRPHLIVSVHPMVQHLMVQAMADAGYHAPFCTVVTDLATAHRAWFHPTVDRCFVAGAAASARAAAWGLSPTQIRVTGVPVRAEFVDASASQATARAQLHVAPDLPLALVLGGGDGVGDMAAVTRHLAAALAGADGAPRGQIAVVCGRNETLRRRLARQVWPVPVSVHGYVENMAAWMRASDCVVTKAGPGTIAEALVCGRPLLLTGFIPGQEEGNVAFVVENGAGAYAPAPQACARTVAGWFEPDTQALTELAAGARRLAQPHATAEIVREMLALL